MDTLEIPLTDKQKAFIAARVADGSHTSPSDYLLALLNEAQRKQAWDKAEKLVLEGLQSAKRPMTEEDWRQLHDNIGGTRTTDDSKS